jgi:hypothetical protein
MRSGVVIRSLFLLTALAAPAVFQGSLFAQAPTVLTVPGVPGNPSSHHTSWTGNPVTLKGSMTSPFVGTHSFTYDWDPGDGGSHCSGSVSDPFTIECAHTYTGSAPALFTAVLTVTDTTSSVVSGSGGNCPPSITQGTCYYTELDAPPPNLPIEVNNAIDKGLWALHKNMRRTTSSGVDFGDWNWCDGRTTDGCQAGATTAPTALDCVAFENASFLQTTTPANPYNDDVRRCINKLFNQLTTLPLPATVTNTYGTFNPDQNGNNIAIQNTDGNQPYQLGSVIDALVATGTPSQVIPTGTTLANAGVTHPGGGAYTYRDAVLDLVDFYSYCQGTADVGDGFGGISGYSGGWRYSCQAESDNSTNQWAAIGMIPASRVTGWAATIPPLVLQNNRHSLHGTFGQNSTLNGEFGYTTPSPAWGPFATTPSGLVQLAMQGLGRGKQLPTGESAWDSAETFMRDNFDNNPSLGAGSAPKPYIYGLLSFTKSMLLHSNDGVGVGTAAVVTPIEKLHSSDNPSLPDIDWYAAQSPAYGGSDTSDGVARYLINIQSPDGSWFGHSFASQHYYLETAMAITMLRHTVFKPVPTACAHVTPSPVANGGTVTLNGSCSSPGNFPIVTWKWDISGTAGTNFNPPALTCVSGPACVKATFAVHNPGSTYPYNYPVRLRIWDSDSPQVTEDVILNVVIGSPPVAPTANAGGPYNFCPAKNIAGAFIYAPFKLDGSHSTNPDQGTTDGSLGAPPSTITAYDWDFSCGSSFNDAHGSQPDVTTAFTQPGVIGTGFNVCLRVTNNDNLAFPTAGLPSGLTSTGSAQVNVNATTDPNCTHCVATQQAVVKTPTPGVPGNIQLYWTDTNSVAFPIDHYNVYRSTVANFSTFVQLAGAASTPHINPIAVPGTLGAQVSFTDNTIAPGTTYYYRVAPATASDQETCASPLTLPVSVGACPRCR